VIFRTSAMHYKGSNKTLPQIARDLNVDAVVYAALGDRDRAIMQLEKAVQTRSLMPFVLADPQLDSLRSDPRFEKLCRRAGLPS
jgi:hypothetical protein